jgi:hypothetical protein
MASASTVESSVPEEELEELEIEQPDAEQAAIEARAREMGWHPFAEYRGPPGKWVDAATFVERGDNILPIVRANNHRLEERVKKLGDIVADQSRTISEQRQVLEEMRTFAKNADERGYKRALAELTAQRDAAEEAGDIKTFKQIDEQIDELEETRAESIVKPPPVPPVEKPKVDPAVLAFVEANPWFNTDNFLNAQMIAEHLKVIRKHPSMPLGDQLDLAAENLKAAYPESFGDEPREEPPVRHQPTRRSSVAAPTNSGQPQRRQATGIDTIADPEERKEAREAFNRTKRQIPDYTEAEYMAVYDNPRADVITLRKEKKNARA